MKLYAIVESMSYGVYVHIIRAKDRKRAIEIAEKNLRSDGKIREICQLSLKGKEEHILCEGMRE